MNILFISVIFGLIAILVLVLLVGAGFFRVLGNALHSELLATRERVENARDLVYFMGGLTGLAPAILRIETDRPMLMALVGVTALVVFTVNRALTRRLEEMR